jgi:hypothetical protein
VAHRRRVHRAPAELPEQHHHHGGSPSPAPGSRSTPLRGLRAKVQVKTVCPCKSSCIYTQKNLARITSTQSEEWSAHRVCRPLMLGYRSPSYMEHGHKQVGR